MKTLLGITFALAIAWIAPLARAVSEAPDFERYQVILTRLPFGAEPANQPGSTAGLPPGPPPESFTKNLKMCAMTRHQFTGKLQVGLVDAATRKNYFLKVGDEEDGILLVDADYDGERALLRKGAEEAWIAMTAGGSQVMPAGRPGLPLPAVGAVTPAGVPPPFTGAVPVPMPGMRPVATAEAAPIPSGSSMSSTRDRLAAMRARRAEATTNGVRQAGTTVASLPGTMQSSVITPVGTAATLQTAPNGSVTVASAGVNSMSDAAREKAEVLEQRRRLLQPSALSDTNQTVEQRLQAYQMDLIRAQGKKGPPLPIQLTPEADDQLVSEGVLPPQQ